MSAEDRLSAIVEGLDAVVFELDREGRLATCAGRGKRALGLRADEPPAAAVHELFRDAAWAADAARRVFAGESVDREGRFRDGTLRLELEPGRDGEGRIVRALGLVHDLAGHGPTDDVRAAARRLEMLSERGPLVIYTQEIGPEGVRMQVSANVTAMLGYSPEALGERAFWHQHIHPEDLARLMGERADLLARGSYSEEFRFRHQDGGWRWLHCENTVVHDEAGQPTELYGFLVDVTDRHAARAYAEQSIAFESRVIAEAKIGIVVFDLELRYRLWNPYIARLLGIDAAEVVGRTPWEIFPGQARTFLRRDLRRALAGVVTSGVRELENRQTGVRVTMAATLAPMQSAAGELLGVVLILRDISEERRLQEAYESSERSFRALIDEAPDGMLVLRDGRVIYANRSLLALLGHEVPGDLLGRPVLELVRADQRALAEHRLAHVEGAAFAASQDYAFLGRGGREVPVELRSTRISFDGQPALLAICRDQTERLALQTQLMASDRLSSMGALAAGVGHEINNPLAAILANLDTGLRELEAFRAMPGLAAALEPLRDAREAAIRLKDIARDLKLFSRAEDEGVAAVDLAALMDSTLRLAHNEIKHRASLRRDYRQVPRVLANQARLGQVFLNLLINATQAIPEGHAAEHEIVVTLRGEAEHAIIEVRDTGSGIAPPLLARIFEPFFTTKPAGVGTGLGLAVCQRLVQAAGGTILAESEPGKGSLFRVTLPAAEDLESTGERQAVRLASPEPSRRGTLLVVDDDANVARSIARTLKRWHDVTVETDAGAALGRLREGQRFDMILCDIMMPTMSGMDFHAALGHFATEVADEVVFMSGGVFSNTAREFLDRVPNTLVEKPFDPTALHLLVEERMRMRRADRSG
jgi:PAS domain S-box-containing protein